jgi:acyl-CoA thioester hydrolase
MKNDDGSAPIVGRGVSLPESGDCSTPAAILARGQPPARHDEGKGMTTLAEHTIEIRVRYPEVDAMGFLHHSRFLQYFEMGRVELLRARGTSYADLERQGIFFAVTRAEVKYKAPARYDELLTLTTRLVRQTHVRFDHAYTLCRGDQLLAEGQTTIACLDRAGRVIEIPDPLKVRDEA